MNILLPPSVQGLPATHTKLKGYLRSVTELRGRLSAEYDTLDIWHKARTATKRGNGNAEDSPHGMFRMLRNEFSLHALEFLRQFGSLGIGIDLEPYVLSHAKIQVDLEQFWRLHAEYAQTLQIYECRDDRALLEACRAGEGRFIPLNSRAVGVLSWWAAQFPDRLPSHCVFPSEHYGAAGDKFIACVYKTDPLRPIGRWKEAWEAAKIRAGVSCRFHDLRHTACTRMLEAGVPFAVVAEPMGWSASTAIRMAKRYGHIGQNARAGQQSRL
jgi:hypothetical protein